MYSDTADYEKLNLISTIGFRGHVPNGLLKHPDGNTIYSLGSTVIISNSKKEDQKFLQGHTNVVTCITASKDGKYIASGQVTHMGFQADIIVWEYSTGKLISRLTLHKVKVQALAFSPSGKFLASLGGEDDNAVIVWDMETQTAICGAPASSDSSGSTLSLTYFNNDDLSFVTGGNGTLRLWKLNPAARKVRASDCQTGQIKRIVKCISVDQKDEFMYCGTTTGDLLRVSLGNRLFKNAGPLKEKEFFSLGVLSTAIAPSGEYVVLGCGDGTIATLSIPKLAIMKKTKVDGNVTSITFEDEKTIKAGTSHSNVYLIDVSEMTPKMMETCHYSQINDVCFPPKSSDIFATAADDGIRIWNARNKTELLKIQMPNLRCNCITFKNDGSSLISGWTDGKIRAFGPQSGRLQYVIHDAHKNNVTALAATDCYNEQGDFKIVSGDGQVRIWRITKTYQQLDSALKEHKGTVTCVKIRKNGLECISSSSDGSCIIWDLSRYVRNQVLFAPSFFHAICYYPDESQILTSGTDRKVAYWEAYDGSLIREIQASQSDSIYALDITPDGKYFVAAGSDKIVKLYKYEEGDVAALGLGHSTDVTKVRVSPNGKIIVSVSTAGAIFQWKVPE